LASALILVMLLCPAVAADDDGHSTFNKAEPFD
jgi:hypothetical protein